LKATYDEKGRLHSFGDNPAIVWSSGGKEWFYHGLHHRDGDKPAVIGGDGHMEWYKHGKRHRDNDKPAVIWANGSEEYWRYGKIHRDNGPALKYENSLWHYKNGRLYFPGDEGLEHAWQDLEKIKRRDAYECFAAMFDAADRLAEQINRRNKILSLKKKQQCF